MAMSGLFHVRTEFQKLLVIPSLAYHPKQTNRWLPGHGDFGDLFSTPRRQVHVLTVPFWDLTAGHLCRFNQEGAQQRIALLGDMSQPTPLSARVLQGH